MIDQKKVILMTKLALHEKKYGKIDGKRNSYFKWDYIYINNWQTRFAVGIAAFIVISWMIFTDVYIDDIIPILDVDIRFYVSRLIVFCVGLLLVYTAFSTMIYSRRYDETQKRLQEYEGMLKELDVYQLSKQSEEGDLHDTDGSIVSDSE